MWLAAEALSSRFIGGSFHTTGTLMLRVGVNSDIMEILGTAHLLNTVCDAFIKNTSEDRAELQHRTLC